MKKVTLPESSIAFFVHREWQLVPLRIPTGWHVRWNGIDARRLDDGTFEVNDSQDLFWAVREHKGTEITVDAGYYGEEHGFRIDVLEPDWDHVTASYSTHLFDDFISRLERFLLELTAVVRP